MPSLGDPISRGTPFHGGFWFVRELKYLMPADLAAMGESLQLALSTVFQKAVVCELRALRAREIKRLQVSCGSRTGHRRLCRNSNTDGGERNPNKECNRSRDTKGMFMRQ